jgi:hypothetical protein
MIKGPVDPPAVFDDGRLGLIDSPVVNRLILAGPASINKPNQINQ